MEVYYNLKENDINSEAIENLVTISVDEFDDNDTSQSFENILNHFCTQAHDQLIERYPGKLMIFYSWVDQQIPALRFSMVSDVYDKLPFGSYHEKQSDIKTFSQNSFILLRSLIGSLNIENFIQIDPNLEDEDDEVEFYNKDNPLIVFTKTIGKELY